jgi:hypothetical protein
MLVHVFFLRKIFACNFFAFFSNLIYWTPQKPNVLIWVCVFFLFLFQLVRKSPTVCERLGRLISESALKSDVLTFGYSIFLLQVIRIPRSS